MLVGIIMRSEPANKLERRKKHKFIQNIRNYSKHQKSQTLGKVDVSCRFFIFEFVV